MTLRRSKLTSLVLTSLIIGVASLSMASCSKSMEAAHHDHHDDHKHEFVLDKNSQAKFAYTANYKLTKGTYLVKVGHTHEKTLDLALVKLNSSQDSLKVGNKLFTTTVKTVDNREFFTLNQFYKYNLKHDEGYIRVEVPEDGVYTLYTDNPPGDHFPLTLANVDNQEVKPVYSHTFSNVKESIYNGFFTDDMVKDRALSDYEGNWQSVYPYLQDGTLDTVFKVKAQKGTMSFDEYKKYYTVGYKTDIGTIVIKGDKASFTANGKTVTGTYVYDGYHILNYSKGNRGVRFTFKNIDPASKAPKFMQFSDHNIYPIKTDHFHIYLGNSSQAEILKELDNWPTYYPSSLTKEQIVKEMLAH